jgi:oxalate decarboxylase
VATVESISHYQARDETLTMLEIFKSDHHADIALNQWVELMPPELVKAQLNLDDATWPPCPRPKPSIAR